MENVDIIIENIVNTWSEEEVEDFLVNKMPEMEFVVDSRNSNEYTALGSIIDQKWQFSDRDRYVIGLLLKHGADSLQKLRGFSILVTLTDRKETDILIEMLRFCQNIDMQFDDLQITPLHLAVESDLKPVVEYIMSRKPALNKQDLFGQTALHYATRSAECLDIMKILLENGADLEVEDNQGRTPILLAVANNHLEQVELLLSCGANLFASDKQTQSALHLIFYDGRNLNAKLLKLLLAAKCDVNARNSQNLTPFHLMVMNNYYNDKLEIAQQLIDNGANLNVQSIHGDTVLHKIALHCPVPTQFIEFLLKKGADSALINNDNQTFFDVLKIRNREAALDILRFICLSKKRKKMQISDALLEAINSDAEISQHQLMCEKELDILESRNIYQESKLSFFSLLVSNERKLGRLCRNEFFETAMKNFDSQDYPIYGNVIDCKFQKALDLYAIELSCYEILHNRYHSELNSYTLQKIIGFMTKKELITWRDSAALK